MISLQVSHASGRERHGRNARGCVFLVLLCLWLANAACRSSAGLPAPGSAEYRELVRAFYVGLAGLQTGEDVRAKEQLTRATQLVPGEPASWANLGLLAVRQQEFAAAYDYAAKAHALAPENSQLEMLLGIIESKRGRLPEAIAHLQRAVQLDAKNLKALYALAQETERQATATSDADAQGVLARLLQAQPANLAALLDMARIAAKRGDANGLQTAVAQLAAQAANWPDDAKQQLTALQTAASSANPRSAAAQSAFLKNTLARLPAYRQSLNAIKTPVEFVGDPFLTFLKLPSPSAQPAPADAALTFETQPLAELSKNSWVGMIAFAAEKQPSLVTADSRSIQIKDGATIILERDDTFLLWMDFNYDFKMDLVAASKQGIRFFQQESLQRFLDVTGKTTLTDSALQRNYKAAVAFDYDLDGDLDICLSPTNTKAEPRTTPVIWRNNGDGTFAVMKPFTIKYSDTEGIGPDGRPLGNWQSDFTVADIDGDGDMDLAMAGKGFIGGAFTVRVFLNERLGIFRELIPAVPFDEAQTLNAADLDGNGIIELVTFTTTGELITYSFQSDEQIWERKLLGKIKASSENSFLYPFAFDGKLQIADFDNNGALDLLVENAEFVLKPNRTQERNQPIAQVFLNQGNVGFTSLKLFTGYNKLFITDVNADSKLDLLGVAVNGDGMRQGFSDGKPVQLINRGTKNYAAQTIRTRAAQATGDQRINSFGIGGEIEIRAGLLTQKQIITAPQTHFGLGEQQQTDVARIVWPNGAVQAEFALQAGQTVLAEQRLKGSCPTLFAWNGSAMAFVKDCPPWNPALGLRVNAQAVVNVEQTEEWFKLPGQAIAPRNGTKGEGESFYDLRITGELWETFYLDRYALQAVTHPVGTEVFTDERFAMPQPKPQLYVTKTPRPFAQALDDSGRDVTQLVSALDQQYLDTFGRGQYQGLTRDHWVEVALPEDAPRGQLYLLGHGWLHPTDATINVALAQNASVVPPQGLTLEVPDARGNWVTARTGLGFLSGKHKTMVLDLVGVFRPNAPRRLRLRTNLEIYWDKLEWAEAAPPAVARDVVNNVQTLALQQAELRYRGFSRITQASASSPEVPHYAPLAGTAQKWRDLMGFYTRYGDVRELLAATDDRFVLMNAGDELRLAFAALPAPPAGWTRDFVFIGDGWTKDGDYNCAFAATVLPLPLPLHGLRAYERASLTLAENPAYQRHPRDWQDYHTRYVTPEAFARQLRSLFDKVGR